MSANTAILETILGNVDASAHGDLIHLGTIRDGGHITVNRVAYYLSADYHCFDGTWKNELIGKYGNVQMALFNLRRVESKGTTYDADNASYAARDKARAVVLDALNAYVLAHPEFVDAGHAAKRADKLARLDTDIKEAADKLATLQAERAALA